VKKYCVLISCSATTGTWWFFRAKDIYQAFAKARRIISQKRIKPIGTIQIIECGKMATIDVEI
jgi:hypothetical protein